MDTEKERPNETTEMREASSETQPSESPELGEEIQRVVESLTRAARAAWNSEQRRQLEVQIRQGLRSLVDELEEAFQKVQESEEGQELREKAEQIVARIRSSKVTAEIQEGLLKGLHALAEELQELADRLEAQAQESTSSEDPGPDAAPPQEIPVSKED